MSESETKDVARLTAENEALAKFKAYVHRRLDEAGVPADPESPHKAEGCRIGGRLDLVLAQYQKPPERIPGWKPEWDSVDFSLECSECDGCASGDGIHSPEEAHAKGWTEICLVKHSPISNFYGLCPEHTADAKAEQDGGD